ncbi:SLC13 family permease [Aestuariivirga sp.]|uniref:SLC13 family permease n=1 Tax=Aestuariivirga sp. TaxID=2650926 RepID=UPI003BADA2F0
MERRSSGTDLTGLLSAALTNDVVVFALTPPLCSSLLALKLDPRPYLVGLAGAANAGSALTLIGNPQNILIGQAGNLEFWRYTLIALLPTLLSLGIIYAVVAVTWPIRAGAQVEAAAAHIDRFQLAKALLAIVALIAMFFTPLPREVSALTVAGFLLLSRRLSSREMIGAVDWHLLLLFVCLFGVTAAFAATGVAQAGLSWMEHAGLLPERLSVMTPLTVAFSNTIGNVPAVILIIKLLPDIGEGPLTGLALLSTLAGNLLLTGSMCNIIVAERAASVGARLSFGDFARSGIVMTTLSLAAAAAGLWVTGLMIL